MSERIMVRVSQRELDAIDTSRGKERRSSFVRRLVLIALGLSMLLTLALALVGCGGQHVAPYCEAVASIGSLNVDMRADGAKAGTYGGDGCATNDWGGSFLEVVLFSVLEDSHLAVAIDYPARLGGLSGFSHKGDHGPVGVSFKAANAEKRYASGRATWVRQLPYFKISIDMTMDDTGDPIVGEFEGTQLF